MPQGKSTCGNCASTVGLSIINPAGAAASIANACAVARTALAAGGIHSVTATPMTCATALAHYASKPVRTTFIVTIVTVRVVAVRAFRARTLAVIIIVIIATGGKQGRARYCHAQRNQVKT